MQIIEKGSRIFRQQVLQGSLPKQIAFSTIIASLGVSIFAPIQAFSLGCGFTATLIACHEFREYRRFRSAPIIAPSGKFNLATLEKFNHIEPWGKTLNYCQAAMNLCGGIYLLTHVLITPGIIMTAIAGGSVTRILRTSKDQGIFHHEWVAVGIAGLAAECMKHSSNPISLYFLSIAIGYFGTAFLIKSI